MQNEKAGSGPGRQAGGGRKGNTPGEGQGYGTQTWFTLSVLPMLAEQGGGGRDYRRKVDGNMVTGWQPAAWAQERAPALQREEGPTLPGWADA